MYNFKDQLHYSYHQQNVFLYLITPTTASSRLDGCSGVKLLMKQKRDVGNDQ